MRPCRTYPATPQAPQPLQENGRPHPARIVERLFAPFVTTDTRLVSRFTLGRTRRRCAINRPRLPTDTAPQRDDRSSPPPHLPPGPKAPASTDSGTPPARCAPRSARSASQGSVEGPRGRAHADDEARVSQADRPSVCASTPNVILSRSISCRSWKARASASFLRRLACKTFCDVTPSGRRPGMTTASRSGWRFTNTSPCCV